MTLPPGDEGFIAVTGSPNTPAQSARERKEARTGRSGHRVCVNLAHGNPN